LESEEDVENVFKNQNQNTKELEVEGDGNGEQGNRDIIGTYLILKNIIVD